MLHRRSPGSALEDLLGIRRRIGSVRRKQLARHRNWAFGHLRLCIAYKAQHPGVPVVLVDPRNTSRTCAECGYCDKANRRSQADFLCGSCGHTRLPTTTRSEHQSQGQAPSERGS